MFITSIHWNPVWWGLLMQEPLFLSMALMLLVLIYCTNELSSCRIKRHRNVYVLLVIVKTQLVQQAGDQEEAQTEAAAESIPAEARLSLKKRIARCLKYKYKWDHMLMIITRAPVVAFLQQNSQQVHILVCVMTIWICHVLKDHRGFGALWTAAHTHTVATKQSSHHAISGVACQPSSGTCHLRSDSHPVILHSS